MSFFVELWESIFTPGTSPALLKATHASFIMLLMSLLFLIYYTRSIHFVNLFVIASLLYGAVIWFVNELKNVKMKDNQELATEEKDKQELATEEKKAVGTTSGSTVKPESPVRAKKRKA